MKDVSYSHIPRRMKSDKHRAVALWMETIAGSRVANHAEFLAHHNLKALELARAARYTAELDEIREDAGRWLFVAGQRALALDVGRAEQHLRQAIELLPEDSSELPNALASLAEAVHLDGRMEEAQVLRESAIQGFRAQGRTVETADAMVGLARTLSTRGEVNQAQRLVREAVTMLRASTLSPELARALSRDAGFLMQSGRHEEAIERAQEAFNVAEEVGDAGQRARALGVRGSSRVFIGDVGGLDDLRLALSSSLALGLSGLASSLYNNLSVCLSRSTQPADGLACMRQGIEFAGARGMKETALWMRGEGLGALFDLGRWDEAYRTAADVRTQAQQQGADYLAVLAEDQQAWVLVHLGSLPEAGRVIDDVLPRAREIGDLQVLVPALSTAALFQQASGNSEQALACVNEVSRITEDSGRAERVYYLPSLARVPLTADNVPVLETLVQGVEATLKRDRCCLQATRAMLAEVKGELAEASDQFGEAYESWSEYGHVFEQAHALLGRGRCLVKLGQFSNADQPMRSARDIFATLGARPALAETESWLARV